MSRDNDLRDCSRAWLESAAETLQALVDAGYPMQARLNEIHAAIPHAADYPIDHRDRDCRRS